MNGKRAVLTAAGIFAVISAVQPVFAQGNLVSASPLPPSRILIHFGLEQGWWGQAVLNSTRDKIRHIAIDERSVIVVSTSGIVTSFDAENGRKMWVTRVGRRDHISFMPVMNKKQVLIASGMKLFSLDRLEGGVTWEIDLPKMPSTAPAADDERVYIGTLDGSVYAFDLKKIEELYQERLLPEYSLSTRAWRYKAGKKITSPPVVTPLSVNFASLDHSLYSVGPRTRNLRFQFETDGPISAPLVKQGPYIYVASEDFNFYCLNANNGKVQWSFLSGLPIRKSPYVIDNRIYILPDAGGIVALKADTGRHAWPAAQLKAVNFLAATRHQVITTDQIGNVLLLNPDDGSVIGLLPLISFNFKPANAVTDRLFLAKENGLIVMIREQGSDFPAYHKYPERRPILPELYNPQEDKKEQAEANPPKPNTEADN